MCYSGAAVFGGPAYLVRKGCVLCRSGTEPSGLADGRFTRETAGTLLKRKSWAAMHHKICWAMKYPSGVTFKFGKWRLHWLPAFEGVFELEQPCHAKCDLISQQMQPLKDEAPELGRSIFVKRDWGFGGFCLSMRTAEELLMLHHPLIGWSVMPRVGQFQTAISYFSFSLGLIHYSWKCIHGEWKNMEGF